MKYRSRTDIAADILQIASGGAIKTRIMYRAFLSFPQQKEYLQLLIDAGMLEYLNEGRMYRTTERGTTFLKSYKELREMLTPGQGKAKTTRRPPGRHHGSDRQPLSAD